MLYLYGCPDLDDIHLDLRQGRSATSGPLIVHVARQFIPNRGGLEDVVANLGRQLVARGARVRVVTLDRLFKEPEHRLPPFETIDGIEVVRIPWRGSSRYPVAPSVFARLADADLVHVHGIDFFYDALALGWPLHRRPMVVTTHGGFFHTPKFARLKRIWFRTMTRASASAYRAVITCSEADQAMFARIVPDKAVLIENGVNIEKFSGAGAATARRRVVTIGRFSQNKRIDRLLDAMAVVARDTGDWHLDVIGTPYDISEDELRAEVAGRGLADCVFLHIRPSEADIAALLGSASLFASASEHEGFGLAAVEGMSAGLVPVLHGNEAYKALGRHHAGVVVTDFSAPQQAAAALRAADAAVENDPAGMRAAMMKAAGNYSWSAVSKRYVDIYDKVVPGLGLRAREWQA